MTQTDESEIQTVAEGTHNEITTKPSVQLLGGVVLLGERSRPVALLTHGEAVRLARNILMAATAVE